MANRHAGKESKMRLAPISLIAILCCVSCLDTVGNQSQATPPPPVELESLPQQAQVLCHHSINLDEAEYILWEFPGVPPLDRNSAYQGERGRQLGKVRPCDPVTIISTSWSQADQEYWVQIRANGKSGWIKFRYLSFSTP